MKKLGLILLVPAGVLNGHSENVRALKWCTELPFILYSGSWDATIRIWNTDTNECLCVIKEHQADVYQIASHPGRPFLFYFMQP